MGRRNTLLLSILTLITAMGWIVFDVYHASIDTTIPQDVEEKLSPVVPNFDKNIIQKIKERQAVLLLESPATAASNAATISGEIKTGSPSGKPTGAL